MRIPLPLMPERKDAEKTDTDLSRDFHRMICEVLQSGLWIAVCVLLLEIFIS